MDPVVNFNRHSRFRIAIITIYFVLFHSQYIVNVAWAVHIQTYKAQQRSTDVSIQLGFHVHQYFRFIIYLFIYCRRYKITYFVLNVHSFSICEFCSQCPIWSLVIVIIFGTFLEIYILGLYIYRVPVYTS